jgi:hypothetical protein
MKRKGMCMPLARPATSGENIVRPSLFEVTHG